MLDVIDPTAFAFTSLTAVFSIIVGTLLLAGQSSRLPAIFGG